MRPSPGGANYDGPVRIPVNRRSYKGSLARPYRPGLRAFTAGFTLSKTEGQRMAEQHRAENKEKQTMANMVQDCSVPDPITDWPDYHCRVLKTVKMDWQPHGGQRYRVLFRRQARFISISKMFYFMVSKSFLTKMFYFMVPNFIMIKRVTG